MAEAGCSLSPLTAGKAYFSISQWTVQFSSELWKDCTKFYRSIQKSGKHN
jgi:hypothetical protein